MTTETDRQYAQRILRGAIAAIDRLEPLLLQERNNAACLRTAMDALRKMADSRSRLKALVALQAELQKAVNEECEIFNTLQDHYKDRRKFSAWLESTPSDLDGDEMRDLK
jgi:hypothetical protein